ncbi:hypothetical protein FACS1894184_18100 [Clostridia bacterium]|nr:hypothetical protein FACS1894184_18100 [Clostridia bacterium]
MICIDAAVRSHTGRVRRNNEDNFYFHGDVMPLEAMDRGAAYSLKTSAPYQIYAVCDGLGGEAAGERASTTAVNMLVELEGMRSSDPDHLARAISQINEAVCKLRESESGQRVGSTITMAVIEDDHLRLVHLGDSRVYCYRQGEIIQMTVDHTQAQRRVRLGIVDQVDASRNNGGNALTQHLGVRLDEMKITPDISQPILLTQGEYWIICSDGLTDPLSDEGIAECCALGGNAGEVCDRLVRAALDAGGWDNVTVIVLRSLPADGKDCHESKTTRPIWEIPTEETDSPTNELEEHMNTSSRHKRFRWLWTTLLAALAVCLIFVVGFWLGQTGREGVDNTPVAGNTTATPTGEPNPTPTFEPTASALATLSVETAVTVETPPPAEPTPTPYIRLSVDGIGSHEVALSGVGLRKGDDVVYVAAGIDLKNAESMWKISMDIASMETEILNHDLIPESKYVAAVLRDGGYYGTIGFRTQEAKKLKEEPGLETIADSITCVLYEVKAYSSDAEIRKEIDSHPPSTDRPNAHLIDAPFAEQETEPLLVIKHNITDIPPNAPEWLIRDKLYPLTLVLRKDDRLFYSVSTTLEQSELINSNVILLRLGQLLETLWTHNDAQWPEEKMELEIYLNRLYVNSVPFQIEVTPKEAGPVVMTDPQDPDAADAKDEFIGDGR